MKTLFPFLMFAVFLGTIYGATVYLSQRLNFFFDTQSIRTWYGIFILLVVFMVAGVITFSNTTNEFASFLYQVAAVTMGFFLYFLMTLLFVDLVNYFVKMPPRTVGISAIVITSLFIIVGVINSFNIKTTHVDIPLKGLTKNIKAVHLSDVHIGHFRGIKWMQQMVEKTNAENPDVVFITGDLFDGRINLTPEVLEPLRTISAPIYFVEGNHDGYSGVKEVKAYLREKGVRVLENEVERWNDLQIIGFNHMRPDSNSVDMHASKGTTMQSVYPKLNIDQTRPTILLHHSPEGIEYANQYGVDLYLSGHTHGGQQFPVTLINELLFKYNRGLNDYMGTKILVSEGVGTFGPPIRIGTKSEIIVIHLKPELK
jgi:predicted MPP superfamily phosphohydrolase